MRSKKGLMITGIFCLAIFLVTLVICMVTGRPWWLALLFSMAFFLLSVIVTRPGLLIPERIFGEEDNNEPTEVTTKDDFHEKMDLMLADLSTQPEATTEDVRWMTEYTRLMKEVCELVYAVHEGVWSQDRVKELRAFREATKELPRLINQFKDIPELELPERQTTIEQQIEGLELYLETCSDFIEAIENSDGKLAGEAAMQINKALKLLDIMDKSQTI